MKTMAQRWVGGALSLLLFASSFAVTQASESLRGTIENVDGETVLVKTRGGMTISVKLLDDTKIFILNPASLADLKPGSFAGIVTKAQADSTEKVLEIYIFPSDPARDPFEIPTSGLFTPSDASQVLNYIEGLILKNDGRALTVRHQDSDDTIPVSADAKIVVVAPATVTDIKVGQKFFVPNGRPVSLGMVAPTIILGE